MATDLEILRLALRHRQGAVELDVSFHLTQPWTVLFGPSGSGKTTILRSIVGTLQPRQGCVELHGSPQLDTAKNIFVPPHRRAIRIAGQASGLFPHLNVDQNLRYGVRAASAGSGSAADDVVTLVCELFQLAPLARKLPHTLSGGEQQRVSLARAVASAATTRNALLLLDEPFNGLDLSLRDDLIVRLRAWLRERKIPVLSVTHDVSEAFLLGAEVLRLAEGRIAEQGPVERVLGWERLRILKHLGAGEDGVVA